MPVNLLCSYFPCVGELVNESCEFHVFSSDNKVWCFEAVSTEVGSHTITPLTPLTPPQEAASWVKAIGEQIKKTISESVSHKKKGNSSNELEKKEILVVEGNNFCADCNSPSKRVY